MLVTVVGRPVNLKTTLVNEAVKFYGEYLMGKRLANNVEVTVIFERFKKGSDEYAYCDYEIVEPRLRCFEITIDSRLNKKETLLALAHEMVHVKQYAKGEMKDLFQPARMVKYKGEKYPCEDSDYWEHPWEIEAYGREKGLYIKFISQTNENK